MPTHENSCKVTLREGLSELARGALIDGIRHIPGIDPTENGVAIPQNGWAVSLEVYPGSVSVFTVAKYNERGNVQWGNDKYREGSLDERYASFRATCASHRVIYEHPGYDGSGIPLHRRRDISYQRRGGDYDAVQLSNGGVLRMEKESATTPSVHFATRNPLYPANRYVVGSDGTLRTARRSALCSRVTNDEQELAAILRSAGISAGMSLSGAEQMVAAECARLGIEYDTPHLMDRWAGRLVMARLTALAL